MSSPPIETDPEYRDGLLGLLADRILEVARHSSEQGALGEEDAARIRELAGGYAPVSLTTLSDRGTATPRLARLVEAFKFNGSEILVFSACLAAELSSPLFHALGILSPSRRPRRRLRVEMIASLLGGGQAGVLLADAILRGSSRLVATALVSLGKLSRPFPNQQVVCHPRLLALARGSRDPGNGYCFVAAADAELEPTSEAIALRTQSSSAGLLVVEASATIELSLLAAAVAPRLLLHARADLVDTGDVRNLCREAWIADAVVLVTVADLDVSTIGWRDALAALGSQHATIFLGPADRLAGFSEHQRLAMAADGLRPRMPIATLSSVAGKAALPPSAIDPLGRFDKLSDSNQAVLRKLPAMQRDTVPDAADRDIIEAARVAWRKVSPARWRIGLFAEDTPRSMRVAQSIAARLGMDAVLLSCAALASVSEQTIRQAWRDARNAAASGVVVIVDLGHSDARRVVRAEFADGGLFIFAGPMSSAELIAHQTDQTFEFAPKADLTSLLHSVFSYD